MMKNLPMPFRLPGAGLRKLCCAMLLLLAIPASEAYSQLPPGFIQRKLTGDVINEATSMAHAPDGRIFMAERSGNVKVFRNGAVATVHTVSTTTAAEQGLLGIALHPQFATNGKCYIFYTNPDMTRHYLDVIVINAASQVTAVTRVMEFDPIINGFHNGGALQFRDNLLYIAIGESNSSAESPRPDTYRGKILRLTEDGQPAPGNPYYNEPGASRQRRSIWAKGMRNPWKMSLDPVSQKLFVIDVGGNYEEINDVTQPDPARNYNYGWDQRGRSGPEQADTTIPAVFYYPHSGWGCAITSGVFFNPPSTNYPPQYRNRFYFSDWCSPWLRSVDAGNPGAGWEEFATDGFGSVLGTSVGTDGNIYYIRYNTRGSLWRIEYDNNQAPLVVNQPVSATVVERDPVSFSVVASGATPLSYRWQKNGTDIPGATVATYAIAQTAAADAGSYRCIVSNAVGSDTSTAATLTIMPFNARPEPRILTPAATLTWDALDTVSFSGTATDAEDGVLPASAYHWEVRFFHKDDPTSEHWHPGPVIPAGITAGTFVADNGGESSPNIWFRILLTVTDSDGRTGVDSVDIQPNKVILTAAVNIPGLKLVLGTQGTAPFSKTFVVNTAFTLQAISPQVLHDTSYVFASWEHGGAELQSLRAPAVNTTYLAQYNVSASLQQPFSGTPAALPGKIEAEDFDTGGEGIAYHDASMGNAGNQYRATADVDIEGCSEGGFNIGYVAAGEWLEYTVNVTAPGVYTLAARVATPYDGKSFHLELDGQDITGPVTVPVTGGFQAWQTVYVTTPALTAGVKVLRLVMEAADFNVNYLSFTTGTGGGPAVNIPGRLEAEAYDAMNGIGTEATADEGGGQNIGWVAAGDWMDYHVNVGTAGTYTVAFRVASAPGGGQLELRTGTTTLATVDIAASGGWQSWTTVTATVSLAAGEQTLRIYAAAGDWNLNWFEFTLPENNSKLPETTSGQVYPNPANNMLTLGGMKQNAMVNVISLSTGRASRLQVTNGMLDVNALPAGAYIVEWYDARRQPVRKKFIKL